MQHKLFSRPCWAVWFSGALLLVACHAQAQAQAQAPQTCADLEWPAGPGSKGTQQPLNSPNASKPTTGDPLTIKTEAAQKKARLTCDSKPLAAWAAKPQADPFAQRVAAAVKAGKPNADILAQAIYVVELFPGTGAQGSNAATATWRTEQAQAWCKQQPANVASEDLKIPTNLPTLGDAVQKLDPRAIALSWQVLAGLPANQLKDGCRGAVKRFVEKAKPQQGANQGA